VCTLTKKVKISLTMLKGYGICTKAKGRNNVYEGITFNGHAYRQQHEMIR